MHVVWTAVLRRDDRDSALEARSLLPDPRVRHYWDGDRLLGEAYAGVVKLPPGRDLAWDIYFAFGREATWEQELPLPETWAHQLARDDRHLGDGSSLRAEVQRLLD